VGTKRRALDDAPRVYVDNRQQWRAWLQANHQRDAGIWLCFYKKHHSKYLPWGDIVQEALCFGWIDSLPRRLDDDRTMLYVSPRKPGSPWSGINKRHVAELEERGLLHSAGRAKIDAARKDGSWELLDDVEAMQVPDDLAAALDRVPGARAGYAALTDGRKRGLLWWVKTAGTASTRQSRIDKTAAAAAEGRAANE